MIKKSQVFYSNAKRKQIEQQLQQLLNRQNNFLSDSTINSPRAVGEAIQSIIAENFRAILGDLVVDYFPSPTRRAMEDLAFTDKNGFYYAVDVKTHRLDTDFNMPNLTSVKRLAQFYEEDKKYFCLLKVDYTINGMRAEIKRVTFAPIEFFAWDCLSIGALGWGQIQIKNANAVRIVPKNIRKNWMLKLCDIMPDFYTKEIGKINNRLKHFGEVRQMWEKK